ncbi:MAG: flagellar filament capping protein FliD, partial [Spirochaetota bacterium]
MATNTTSIYLEETLKKAIDAEVQKKSQPLESAKKRRTQFQREASAYESVREKLTVLNTASKELFGFRSPFKTLKGVGEGVGEFFDITAARDAERTPHTVEVKSVAKNHKFASRPVSKSEQIPAGQFTVRVGGQERTITFKGGSPTAFAKVLGKELGDELKLTLVQKDRDNQVIVFDVIKTGIKNRFQVIKDDSGVLKWLDLFGERRNLYLDYTFAKSRENELTVENDAELKFQIRDDVLTLKPKNKVSVALTREADVKPGLVIDLLIRAVHTPKKTAKTDGATNTGDGADTMTSVLSSDSLAFDKLAGVTFGEIVIDAETVVPFGDWAKPKVAAATNTNAAPATNMTAVVTNAAPESGAFNGAILGVGYVDASGTPKEKYFSITNVSGNFQKYSVAVDTLFAEGDIIRRVIFANPNDEHEVSYRKVVVENPKTAETISKYPVQDPENAKIVFDGVQIEKDNNDMKDVGGGVTVHPKKRTDGAKTFTLEPDKEVIVGRI